MLYYCVKKLKHNYKRECTRTRFRNVTESNNSKRVNQPLKSINNTILRLIKTKKNYSTNSSSEMCCNRFCFCVQMYHFKRKSYWLFRKGRDCLFHTVYLNHTNFFLKLRTVVDNLICEVRFVRHFLGERVKL